MDILTRYKLNSSRPSINKQTEQKGFTLIELLVVIGIIGLLSAIILVSINSVRGKARDAKRQAELSQIKTAIYSYQAEHGIYPDGEDDTYGAQQGIDWSNKRSFNQSS